MGDVQSKTQTHKSGFVITSWHIFCSNLRKISQGLCYSVLEFSIEPTLLIFKEKLDTQDNKKNEQVTE